MDEREHRLPAWARELIADLRRRVQTERGDLQREVTKLQSRVKLLDARCGALNELLECAAKGGHTTATEIMNVIGAWSLTLSKEE